MKNKKKTLLMSLAAVLLVVAGVFGTMAFLTDKTDPLTNTFTVGNIDITLDETKEDFKMVPGNAIEKDPKITVEAGSEDAWVFVKVDESENLDNFIKWSIANEWTELDGNSGVYYREYDSDNTGPFNVLEDNKVTVKEEVTKKMMDGLTESENYPTLTFTAYAVQKDNLTVEQAWEQAQKEANY